MNLTPGDLEKLKACGISEELARQAQLRRVDSAEGAQIIGQNGSGDYAGVIFPYIWPGETGPREYRLRRDRPDMEYKGDKLKERNKYLTPPGRSNLLYLVPGTVPEWLADTSLPVIIAEGEKKTLALWVCAWHGLGDTAEMPHFLPVGVSGAWNWRGTVGKAAGPNGERRNVKGTISDLHRITWKSRRVTVLYDTNVRDNTSVQDARSGLTTALQKVGAIVSWFAWPDDTPEGINGIDDLIGLWGAEKVRQLIADRARPSKITAADRPTTREFVALGDNHYCLKVPNLGITLDIDRARRERSELIGELSVSCELPGARTFDGSTISAADFNLSSARGRQDRAKLLADRSNTIGSKELDWQGLLEELCIRVIRANREGDPSVTMGRPDPNYRRDLMYNIDGLMLLQKHPTILFGGPGSNKSYIALRALGKLAEQGKRVLYLDWELCLDDHEYRLSELFSDGIPAVEYMRCYRPLVDEVDRIQQAVRTKQIDYIAYDSAGFACGGAPESAETTLAYFRAVRQIGIGSLHIAHNPKPDMNGKVYDREPFGSRFWTANARQMWFAGTDESTINPKMVALFCRKANLDRLLPPVAYRIQWTDHGTCEFTRADIADSQELSQKLSVRERVYQVLTRGPKTVTQIAEELEIEPNTVTQTVNRYIRKGKVFIVLEGESTNRKIGLLGRDTVSR